MTLPFAAFSDLKHSILAKAGCLAPSLLAVACLLTAGGADWLQFRGSQSNSFVSDARLPATWSETDGKNLAWKKPLPGKGVSSPIIVQGRVIVTASSGPNQDRLHVLCFDGESGELRWERQFWATGRTLCHTTSAVAAPSPASDGERIFAFYSSNDLACLNLEGDLIWYRGLSYDYPHAGNDVGMASSPVVVGQTVVVQIENQDDSFAAGLDTATGETRWRHERRPQANWTSPVGLRGKAPADDIVLLQSPGLTAYHAATGEELWRHETGGAGIPSVTIRGDIIFLPGGTLSALRRNGDSLASEILWENNKLAPGNASPVVAGERIYVLNKAGVFSCGEVASGKILWQLRLKGPFWASPVIAGTRAVCVNQDGVAQVVELAGSKGELLGESNFGESVMATPAVADNALYVRSAGHLWKIADAGEP